MSVKIILKNSSVEDRRPIAGQLENGEIALNYNEAGAFLTCKDTNGDIQQVGGVKINEVAPDAPPIQCLWFQPSSLTLFVYDGDSWLPVAGGGGGGTPGGGDITQIIGNQGIDANEIAGIVTLDVELDGTNCGLKFNSSKLSAEIASDSKLGSVKIGDGIDVAGDGTISVEIPQALTFKGSVDLNNPPTGQVELPSAPGDAYVNSATANPVDNGWVGIGGEVAQAGDLVVWDGSEWEIIGTGGTPDVDLGYAAAPNNGTVTNTGGSDAVIPIADDTNAGLFTAAEKLKLEGIEANANKGLQSGDNVSELVNDAAYITAADVPDAPVTSVNTKVGDVVLDATDVGALASGDNVSELVNDAGYITIGDVPPETVYTGESGIDVTGNEISVDIEGEGLEINVNDKLQASIATDTTLGVVKAGSGIGITADGTISATGDLTVDLGYTPAVDSGLVTNTSGNDATIPLADDTNAGLFTAAEKSKLAGLNDNATNDGRYLRVDSAAGDQTVESTGTTTFDGLVEAGEGVKVTGGVGTNIFAENTTLFGIQNLSNGTNYILPPEGQIVQTHASTIAVASVLAGTQTYTATESSCVRNQIAITEDTPNPINGFTSWLNNEGKTANEARYFNAEVGSNPGSYVKAYGFYADTELSNPLFLTDSAYGFYGDLSSQIGLNTYNFYAGTAPNFFAGNTYIGGTTARNTRELWESLLTEEQKEELAAGTLVAPANVATPGDGSFARQWYYDQQDAETQALLDSGELEYPKHFAAATFTDTFALGDNTNINLNSDGTAQFKRDVEVGTDNTTGVVLTSPSGNKFRLTVDDAGNLSTVAV